MKKQRFAGLLAALFTTVMGLGAYAQAQSTRESANNLMPNGRFTDNPDDPLEGWTYVFDNKHYMENYKFVSVVTKDMDIMKFPSDPERWLRLDGRDKKWTWEIGGIQIYSPIIRYDPSKRYKITVRARSLHARLPGVNTIGNNPSSRIYPIIYTWNPKAQKTNTPQFTDLREVARLQTFQFDGRSVTGEHSKLQKEWKTVSVTIPSLDRTEQQQRFLEKGVWLSVKFLVMDGGEFNTGFLDIAEVKVEETGPVNEVKLAPGAGTKGADGKAYGGGGAPVDARKPVPTGPVPVNKK